MVETLMNVGKYCYPFQKKFTGLAKNTEIRSLHFMAKNFNEPEDLLSDESFLAWYFKMPGKEQQQWDSWMSSHPEQTQLVQQAISLLEATRMPELVIPLQQIASA